MQQRYFRLRLGKEWAIHERWKEEKFQKGFMKESSQIIGFENEYWKCCLMRKYYDILEMQNRIFHGIRKLKWANYNNKIINQKLINGTLFL